MLTAAPCDIGIPASVRSMRVEDLAQGENLPGWDLRFIQMSAGRVIGHSCLLEIDGLQLLRECYQGPILNQYGCAPAGAFMFGIPLSMQGEGLFNGGSWRDGICMARSDREFNAVVPPTDMLTVIVQRERLTQYVQETEMVDLSQWLDRRSQIVNDAALTLAVATRINDVLTACAEGDLVLHDAALRQAMLHSVLEVLGPVVAQQAGAPAPAFRELSRSLIVRKAREFAMAHIGEPLQVIDICRGTGVSRRALQASFHDVLGVNPATYLRLMRLNGARQALLHPERNLQVQDVVAKWGFWHWSRFSAEYRDLFGEMPSETLRRNSGAPSSSARSRVLQ